MAAKNVSFVEGAKKGGEAEKDSRFKGKHSLDSDEEDEVTDKYDMLNEDDIEGQEDDTIAFDQGTQITPFNMKEELEEGHFDTGGMYIFDRKKDIRDDWMDNIDWVKVQEQEKATAQPEDESDEEEDNFDEIGTYRQMLEYMKPGESIAKALQRLGGGKSGMMAGSASARLKAKKMKVSDEKEQAGDKEAFLKLTELANAFVLQGSLEIYQDTYEKITFQIKAQDNQKKKEKVAIPEGMDDDDALDMFASDFDKKRGPSSSSLPSSSEPKAAAANEPQAGGSSSATKSTEKNSGGGEGAGSDRVRWEFKWEDKEGEELHGPFNSQEMMDWAEDGYFKDGVMVRKVGSDTQFYNSRRIDFDLYV